MGLFRAIVDAAGIANEEAHTARLERGLLETMALLGHLDDRVLNATLAGFLANRQKILAMLPNWSREGRLQLGRQLQDDARKCFDLDQSKSYSLWLSGAWLESLERKTAKAELLHGQLEEFALQIERDLSDA